MYQPGFCVTNALVGRRATYALLAICALTSSAFAQERPDGQSRGSYSIAYQQVRESDVVSNVGHSDVGTSDTQALLFSVDFEIGDKWDFYANVPFIRKRYNGHSPHDPEALEDHVTDEPFLDDGSFHSDFQDLAFGARYTLPITQVEVQPYIGVGIPTSDYPIFAHAAVGQNLQRLDVGARINYLPPFSNFYYSFTLTKAFVEHVGDVNVDHWRFDGEIGYFLNPRITLRGFWLSRQGNGLQFPDDFPPPRNDLHFYEHEGLLARQFVVVGFGANWAFSERYELMMSALRSTEAKFIHEIDHGLTLGFTRSF